MPPLRPCLEAGCPILVRAGRCAEHETAKRTGTLVYNEQWWRNFRLRFFRMLLRAHITPACGATLPSGPRSTVSQCRAQGRLTGSSADGTDLHLHHDPPLTPDEVRDKRRVCDPFRIALLCRECHSLETRTHEARM